MERRAVRSGLLLVLASISALAVAETSAHNPPECTAVRASKPPVIDGVLDDEAWASAPPITDFTQIDPEEGKPATEKTTVRVLYDDDAIYFGARLDDSKPVTSRLGRRDNLVESDWFGVDLDPYHDHRSGATFGVNPANLQFDQVLYNDTWSDSDWDAVWSSAAKVDQRGWTVEVRVPFSQLRFPHRETHTWGINFTRLLNRRNEEDRLIYVPKKETGFVSRFAHLVGISGIRPKRTLELLPYGVARSDYRNTVAPGDPFNARSDLSGDMGLDLKYALASNLTLTGTINPDFGQVEVDPAVVNLSQFELFFPEKRPFFIEGASLFTFGEGGSNWNSNLNIFPPIFFYSRRIGREPQASQRLFFDYADLPTETKILGAAKITGKTPGGWTIGALDAVTDKERAFFARGLSTGAQVVEPLTNYLVARGAKDLGRRGRIGTLFTAVNRDLPRELSFLREGAYSGGVDGYWFFGNKDVILEGFLGATLVEGNQTAVAETQLSPARYYDRPDADHVEFDPSRTSLSGWGGRLSLIKQTGTWRYSFQAQSYSPGFETNDVGFLQRSDITATHAAVLWTNPKLTKHFRDRYWVFFKFQNWNTAGDLLANGYYWEGEVTLLNYWNLFTNGAYSHERLDDRHTRGGPLVRQPDNLQIGFQVGSDRRRKLSARLRGNHFENGEGTNEDEASWSVTYRPTSNLSFTVSPFFARRHDFAQYVRTVGDTTATRTYGNRYVFAEIDQRTLEIGTRMEWTFNSKLSLQLYLQPFISSGDFHHFKELALPRTYDYFEYGSQISFDSVTNRFTVAPAGSTPFSFGNPDFNFRSVRGNAVARWEFRPGSTLYVVWNENRQEAVPLGTFRLNRDLSAIADAPSDDVFLVKISYWLPI